MYVICKLPTCSWSTATHLASILAMRLPLCTMCGLASLDIVRSSNVKTGFANFIAAQLQPNKGGTFSVRYYYTFVSSAPTHNCIAYNKFIVLLVFLEQSVWTSEGLRYPGITRILCRTSIAYDILDHATYITVGLCWPMTFLSLQLVSARVVNWCHGQV